MLKVHLLSFILSQFFGVYWLILAVVMFYRAPYYRRMVKKMNPESGTILLGGLLGLMFGLFFVGIHNLWAFQPTVLVTLVCWFILIFSLLWLSTPERMVRWTQKMCTGKGYYVLSTFILLLSLFFLGRGVYMYAMQHQAFLFLP
jgi:hypothetical protein